MPAADLLLEIGTEEIPAREQFLGQTALRELLDKKLAAARLEFVEIVTMGTPRRLAAVVRRLADRQGDLSEVVTGP
ncbi:MAG: glycine--tRNA ligase subunit beta, partial [Pseudomonadota bacterium]